MPDTPDRDLPQDIGSTIVTRKVADQDHGTETERGHVQETGAEGDHILMTETEGDHSLKKKGE